MPLAQTVSVKHHNGRGFPGGKRCGERASDYPSSQFQASSKIIFRSSSILSLVQQPATFANPIIPAPAAEPWIIHHDGFYLYCESRGQRAIFLRRAKAFTEMAQDEGTLVWAPAPYAANSKNITAPELHWLGGKWLIYYAADDGENENHRIWVLESESDSPFGPYRDRGCLETENWAGDGTILRGAQGQLFLVWSGKEAQPNGPQNLYIAPMGDPLTVAGPSTQICTPEHPWEMVDMPITEAPQVLQRNGLTFIVYSASGSWTVDYCLGMLVNRDGDFLNPHSWEKHGPVFQKTSELWGVGHCCFLQSPDGGEDWIVYQAKSKQKKGWSDRGVHAQMFTWHEDGLPYFGKPAPSGLPLPLPSPVRWSEGSD